MLLLVPVMEIHTCLDEIIATLKKSKDADSADFHHQDMVKQDTVTVTLETNLRKGEAVEEEQVVTLTATIETNLEQGDLETEVDGMKGDLIETEMEEQRGVVGGGGVSILLFFVVRTGLWFASEGASQVMFPRVRNVQGD